MMKFERFKEAAVEWRAQFAEPPALELKWGWDTHMVNLNGVWICPYKTVTDISITQEGFELTLMDGSVLTVVIEACDDHYEIKRVDRKLGERLPQPKEYFGKLFQSVSAAIDALWRDAARDGYMDKPEFLELIGQMQEYRADL